MYIMACRPRVASGLFWGGGSWRLEATTTKSAAAGSHHYGIRRLEATTTKSVAAGSRRYEDAQVRVFALRCPFFDIEGHFVAFHVPFSTNGATEEPKITTPNYPASP
jgi:hypothetical protein